VFQLNSLEKIKTHILRFNKWPNPMIDIWWWW